jgi:hypothetical protein
MLLLSQTMRLRAQSDKYPRRTDRLQDEQFHSGFDTLVSYQALIPLQRVIVLNELENDKIVDELVATRAE